jgi:chemotaxis signal transduction protein
VHAVHARPAVEAGPLTGAACNGIVRQQAQTLALVDPGALLSLGQKGAAPAYAVVLREERPAIAFSADEIWEIARLPHEQIRTVPAQTIGAGGLRGVLAPADLAGAAPADWTAPVLLLDCATLMAHPLLESLGQACRSAGLRDDALAGNATGARKQDAGVVYWAGAELASPMLQVQRVLTYTPADTLVRREGARMGVLLHAGEAITLYDLGTLLGRPGCPEPQAGAPVMVIRSAGQAIGLVVGELRELGMLRPLPQGPSRRFFAQPDALSPALRMGLSMTGEGAAKRAVLTLDLENTAAQLLAA